MDVIKSLEVLEALVSGCSPLTGEIIDKESILNERVVIRALQIAIDELKKNPIYVSAAKRDQFNTVSIESSEIEAVCELFKQNQSNPSASKLTGFFLATRRFKKPDLIKSQLYGKYAGKFSKGAVLDFFAAFFDSLDKNKSKNVDSLSWKTVDYFEKQPFNLLSEQAINQLTNKIKDIGLTKIDGLKPIVIEARKVYYRAYEPWTEKEHDLLRKALEYTNSLDLLSNCFGRSKSSILSYGQKIIYEKEQSMLIPNKKNLIAKEN